MKAISLLLALALLVSVTLASKAWIVIPDLSIAESQSLIFSYDVRVIQSDLTLLLGNAETFTSLAKTYPRATVVGPFLRHHSYLIVERPEFENATPEDEATWSFEALEAINKAGLQIVYAAPLRFLVSAPVAFNAAHYDGFPVETEFITVLNQGIIPVPAKASQSLANAKDTFRADIADLIAQVSEDSLLDFDYYLSGVSDNSNLTTRNSFSDDVYDAANWIQGHFERSGFTVTQESFQSTYGPNVIATLTGTTYPNTFVIVGGHYDSRAASSSSGTARAPGANDDGSGTSALLEIARLISANNVRFRYSVILGAWCGEEQGLVGSRAYAKEARQENKDIMAMLQGDMLAYRVPGERLQVAFPDRYQTPTLTARVKSIINTYVPEIDACDTSACCSDQQSFYEQGYAATFFFERCGALSDNQYHREGDVVDRVGFDVEQWTLITRSLFASLLTLAEAL